ncbi:MAG: hypothetical protein J1F31_04700 [Erysipelotrichales bacterium]|nr:hypothetical protein [Erysipelotrichales bacterium]
MNNNTLLLKLGINPDNFKNTIVDPIKTTMPLFLNPLIVIRISKDLGNALYSF